MFKNNPFYDKDTQGYIYFVIFEKNEYLTPALVVKLIRPEVVQVTGFYGQRQWQYRI
jgi:hypothetical protein